MKPKEEILEKINELDQAISAEISKIIASSKENPGLLYYSITNSSVIKC